LTQQDPKAERWRGRAEVELFNVITRFAFGATVTFTAVTLLCEQLLYYFS
jgi:hypothetical protein